MDIPANGSTNYSASYQATSDANAQITRANQAVQGAQKEADVQLEHIRDAYSQEATTESSKNEDALMKQHLKGYEALRDLKRNQDAEANRIRREGERDVKNTNDYYRDTLYQTEKKSEADLTQLQAKEARESEFVKTTGTTEVDMAKGEQTRKLQDLKHTQDEQYQQLSTASAAQYEQMKTNTLTAKENENAHFLGEYQAAVAQDQASIGLLQHNANQQIRQIRQDTAQKLAAYGSRQTDPFYKMMDMGATLQDQGDRYVLMANIPTHEQEHLSVAVHGNSLVLSGSRRNEEKLDLAPGRTKGTSSYQSFEESFPLPLPVDKNLLTKEFHGNTVVITVPKSGMLSYEMHKAPPRTDRIRAERPQFPGNLPKGEVVSENAEPSAEKKPGSRTLT
jgi:HSP20 family molecular chaperone IbpA